MKTDSTFQFTSVPATAGQVIQVHSRSFYLASLLLPTGVRKHVSLLYAWCRWCDDSIDKAATPEIGRRRLAALRDDLRRMQQGQPPIQACSKWLIEVSKCHDIPLTLCHDLLDAMETDSRGPSIRNEQDLIGYCYRAAGSVGLVMSQVLGVSDTRAFRHAKSLGIAMQLTNIARDVGEDRRIGRCYIPATWRATTDQMPFAKSSKTHVSRLLALAETHYEDGLKGLPYLHWRVRFAIRTAAAFYRAIGCEIARKEYDSISSRAVVPLHRKIILLIGCFGDEIGFSIRRGVRSLTSRLFCFPSFGGESAMKNESRYLVSLGLSLTLIMATALFVLVGINPKGSSYQYLPWIYSVVSAVSAAFFGILAKRYQDNLPAEAAAARVHVSRESHGSRF